MKNKPDPTPLTEYEPGICIRCKEPGPSGLYHPFTNEYPVAVVGQDRMIRLHLCADCLADIAMKIYKRDQAWEKEHGQPTPWRKAKGKRLHIHIPEPSDSQAEIKGVIDGILCDETGNEEELT